MTNQAIGLAQALGCEHQHKTVVLKKPWRKLPGHWVPSAIGKLEPVSDALAPPWPDLVISCGRRSTAVAIDIARQSNGATKLVHIQNPLIPTRYFDLIFAPEHDRLQGENVFQTVGGLTHITPAFLSAARAQPHPALKTSKHPIVGVLIGGSNKKARLTEKRAFEIGQQLAGLVDHYQAHLVITTSRRTGAENTKALKAGLGDREYYLWDGSGVNPYASMLALSDYLLVTADSVSMASEAAGSGKPVYVLSFDSNGRRLRRFHRMLEERGITRAWQGTLEPPWSYTPLYETQRAAKLIKQKLFDT